MARKVHWEYIYLVRDENGREIAEFSTLEEALALVGDDIGVGIEYSGGDAEGDCDGDDDEDYSWDLYDAPSQVPENIFDLKAFNVDQNSSSSEPPWEEPRNPRPRKRPRQTTFQFTPEQVEEMEKLYKETPNPDALAMKELAIALNVRGAKLKAWFDNRRAEEEKNEMPVVLESTAPRIEMIIRLRDINDSP